MKTPNNQKASRKSRSASDQLLQKSKPGKPSLFKLNENSKNSTSFPPKFPKPKSETCVTTTTLALQTSPPAAAYTAPDFPLIPSPKTPKHPKDVLRKSLIKLKSAQCNESVAALRDIIQISRFSPHLLSMSMQVIYKGIAVLLRSLRTTAARTACQAANELFMNMPPNDGPEFVNLVHALLQKSADSNKYLREDALEALDSMVIHVPPAQTIRILLHRRTAAYSPTVRSTASKLLACVLSDSDADSAASLSEDLKTRLVLAATRFLQDDCPDIKFHGMRLITTLKHHREFDSIFQTKISIEMLNRINKIVETVKSTFRHSGI